MHYNDNNLIYIPDFNKNKKFKISFKSNPSLGNILFHAKEKLIIYLEVNK